MTELARRVEQLLEPDPASNRIMHRETRLLLEQVLVLECRRGDFNLDAAHAMARQCQRNHPPAVDLQFGG